MRKINNTQLLKDTGLKIVHIRKAPEYPSRRDLTVAYREGHDILEIATAIVNPIDCFCRKIGTKQAVENFVANKTIRIPLSLSFDNQKISAVETIHNMFYGIV